MVFAIFTIVLLIIAIMAILIDDVKIEGNSGIYELSLRVPGFILLGMSILFLGLSSITTVNNGHVGLVKCFGAIQSQRDPGIAVVLPWCNVQEVNVQTQTYTMVKDANAEDKTTFDDSMIIQTSDNASLSVDAAVIWRIDRNQAKEVAKNIKDPKEVVRNLSRSAIRLAPGELTVDQVLSTGRAQFQKNIFDLLEPKFIERGFILESVELQATEVISSNTQEAIDNKIAAKQNAEAAKFKTQEARELANQKREAAQGDADAQEIRNSVDPSPAQLQKQYIEAIKDRDKVIITDGNTPVLLTTPSSGG